MARFDLTDCERSIIAPLLPNKPRRIARTDDRRVLSATVIGGTVHRGESDGLQGAYFFAGFIFSKVFTLSLQGAAWTVTGRTTQIVADAGAIGRRSERMPWAIFTWSTSTARSSG